MSFGGEVDWDIVWGVVCVFCVWLSWTMVELELLGAGKV